MKPRQSKIRLGVAVITLTILCSCGNMADRRTPEKWLSLAYSGLAAMDQYEFTGSLSVKAAGGALLKPETFEGKVIDHKQLTVQTASQEPLHWNPVQVLEALNRENKKVIIANETVNTETVTLLINEEESVSKRRWEKLLTQQVDQLALNRPMEVGQYKEEWERELTRSRKQLDEMLSSMQVMTNYELVIDKNRLLPLKMDEKTIFNYKHGKQMVSEERHAAVRFQSFDGSSSHTVQ